ncbi:Lipoxygenase y domain-containing protein 1, partial [Branchiostoma belcheri]
MPTQLQYMNSSPGVRNSMRWAAEPPAVTQPVTTLDPRPPYAVARPRSAPIRPRPDKWVDPYVDPRPQFRTTSAIVHRARRKTFDVKLHNRPLESHYSKYAPFAPRAIDRVDNPHSFPSYDPMSDPHLSDYFARKFGYDPRPPSAVARKRAMYGPGSRPASAASKRPGSATGKRKHTRRESGMLYKIVVRTADRKNAGTDARVFLKMKGTKGKVPKKGLYKKSGSVKDSKTSHFKFERGTKHTFKLRAADIGDIETITVEHDGLERKQSWLLESVTITNTVNKRSWVFPCNDCSKPVFYPVLNPCFILPTARWFREETELVVGVSNDHKHSEQAELARWFREETELVVGVSNDHKHSEQAELARWFREETELVVGVSNDHKHSEQAELARWFREETELVVGVSNDHKHSEQAELARWFREETELVVGVSNDHKHSEQAELARWFREETELVVGVSNDHKHSEQAELGHDGLERKQSWLLESVTITNTVNKRSWVFPCNDWLSLFESDCQISRILYAKGGTKYARTEYEVVTVTGDCRGGGTDANVFITLYGKKGTTARLPLRNRHKSKTFERGRSDIFIIKAKNVGSLQKLRIQHDNTGTAPGWFLDRVVVTDVKNPACKFYFPCGEWLAKDEGDGRIARDLLGSKDPTAVRRMSKYKISTYTGNKRGAGTDANVFITLFGEAGDSGERRLDNSKNNFEKGRDDTFMIECPNLGPMRKIRIGHDNKGTSPGWFLDKVIVDDVQLSRVYEFPCNRWFATDEDDGQIQRDLLLTGQRGGYPYQVRVETGDVRNAGTSARVFIEMWGVDGEETSGKIYLDGKFQRGKTDVLDVETGSILSPLSKIVIGHDNSGTGPGWYCEKVQVHCPSTGYEQTFLCQNWLALDEGDGLIERELRETISMRQTKTKKVVWNMTVWTTDKRSASTDANVYFVLYTFNCRKVAWNMTVWTTDKRSAGTDANVYFVLYGDKGKSDDISIGNKTDNFEAGQEDNFKVEIKDVGKPYKIRIGHDDSGSFAGWHLDKVEMERVDTGEIYLYRCGRWLDKGEDDGQIVREMPAEGKLIKKPLPVVMYDVEVHTGKKRNAGTNADVFVCLFGELGDTGNRPLLKSSNMDKFERGKVDEFQVEAVTLKQVTKVRIGHDGTGSGSGWYLDKVVVREHGKMKSEMTFACDRWLDKGEDDGLIVRDLLPEGTPQLLATTSYHVSVKTGDERNAGTDADVFLKIFGAKGDTGLLKLYQSDNTSNKFERDRTDLFKLEAADIGKIEKIRIGHDDSGPGSGWFLDKVDIDVPSHGERYVFSCHRWLASDEGDEKTEVELFPTEVIKGDVRIPYEVDIYTGDIRGAGTDANVFLQIYGTKGKTEEVQLRNRTDNFEREAVDKFKIEQKDVGPITKIRIGHDGTSFGAGWFLNKVYLFVVNRWLAKDEDDKKIVRELVPTDEAGKPLEDNILQENEYVVRVYTGDKFGAGTDANVFLSVHGENGDTGERELKDSETNTNKWERGNVDRFTMSAINLGEVKKVKVRHDNKGGGAAWFLDRVEVEDVKAKKKYYFPCQRWLATDEDDGQIARELVPVDKALFDKTRSLKKGKSTTSLRDELGLEMMAQTTTYHVNVKTGDVRGAGTDANVYTILYGENDDTGTQQLKTSKNNSNKFERNQLDEFTLEAVDIGELKKIKIWHDNKGGFAGWFLESVEINAPSLGQKWFFPCGRWLDKGQDDGKLERELFPTNTATEEYNPYVPYEIITYTSDVSGAGTDADVYVVLFGRDSQTEQKSLCGNKKERKEKFEKAQKDIFIVEMEDVGDPIEKVRIGHDGKGWGAGWHLDKVEVRRLTDDKKGSITYTFPCKRWLARGEDDGEIVRELLPDKIMEEKTRKDGSMKKKEIKHDALEMKQYQVLVYTGDVKGGGTDANVFINIFGENGDTGERKLNKSETHMDKFERGQVDKFQLEAVDLGKVFKVKIRHDNALLNPAWFLDKVEVVDLVDQETFVFHCERWLGKNKDDGKIERSLYVKGYEGDTSSTSSRRSGSFGGSQLSLKSTSPSLKRKNSRASLADETIPEGPLIPYNVKVVTGGAEDNGTNANPYIIIMGAKKKTSRRIPLDLEDKSKFEPASVETFAVEGLDVGDVKKIEFGHDGVLPGQGWFVKEVELDVPTAGKHYYFPCKRWLAKDKEDGLISRVLTLQDAESTMLSYTPMVPYEVTVYTGDISAGGTDGRITMTVFGSNGTTQEIPLEKGEDRFERGKVDILKMELDDVGELKKIRVSHNGKGDRPDWYLEKITLRNQDSGELSVFILDDWISKSKGDGQLTKDIPASVGGKATIKKTTYKLSVKTSDERGAGTDANVSLILFGENGDSGELKLKESETSSNKFERNQTDVFKFSDMLSLGDLHKCRVWHDSKGFGAGWHLEYIEVLDQKTDKSYMFPCGRWLAKDEDDKQIMRELVCTSPDTPKSDREKIAYNIKVVTSDRKEAGTTNDAFLILEGDLRKSKEFSMDNTAKGKYFKQGHTDEFKFATRNVGALKGISCRRLCKPYIYLEMITYPPPGLPHSGAQEHLHNMWLVQPQNIGQQGAKPNPLKMSPATILHVSFSLRKFPIKVRTPDLGLVGDKYSRLKPDLQDVTTASKVCSEERKTSFSGSMFWKAVLSAAHATALSVFFSCRCTLPVGAPNTPPTGRALPVPVFRYIPGSSTDLSAENSNKVRTATLATARDTSGILKNVK